MAKGEMKVTAEEARKRRVVLTKPRTTVLVKVYGVDPVKGLEEKKRDNFNIEMRHVLEAVGRDLDPDAYKRTKVDTGYCLFRKEVGIRITHLVANLKALGLDYTGGFWQKVWEKKRPVQTFQFSTKGEAITIPEAVEELLNNRFGDCSVWCNPRYRQSSSGQFRLDTINLNNPHTSKKPARELIPTGNTYRLI